MVWNLVLVLSSTANLMRSWKSGLISLHCPATGNKTMQDHAELLQGLQHLSRLANRGAVVLVVFAVGTLGIRPFAAGFPAGHTPTCGRAVPGIARSAVYALHVYQLRRRDFTWTDVHVPRNVVAGGCGDSLPAVPPAKPDRQHSGGRYN